MEEVTGSIPVRSTNKPLQNQGCERPSRVSCGSIDVWERLTLCQPLPVTPYGSTNVMSGETTWLPLASWLIS
jgi:hypothetical protein